MCKFIGIDMDGTLLNSSHDLSDENRNAIRNAQNSGVNVVITTGRPLSGVEKFLTPLRMVHDNDYIILYNGALILRASDRKVISESTISLDEVFALEITAQKMGVKIHIVTDSACISPYENSYGKFEADLNDMDFIIKDFSTLDSSTKVYKVMFSEDESVLKPIFDEMPSSLNENYELTMSAPFYIDFLKKGVNKGFGIKSLTEHLSIPKADVICIGDAGNDISMIDYAGLGVAMGNASLDLRRRADFITLNNDEHGVAHVINRFALMAKAV
ncbi:MAG: Cof-type HAD-IIB family hydrolase [Tissierellales bacterium]|jgi:Cof subfamily protein (haloacid dehalogenase superfamily)|nr:Cof-type HAD-IIB family hydrolase [Tissierellales bacterium]